ncbi:methyltransferase [Anaerosporomusa subterranea]|uniref:Methyltransferase n=1 Tax=Anaerosporomusa subterranea TaxID=1794912 RepID=A0A154BLW6_ANASB|nr:cobalamin-dependent protein [Anaerosporomusa subterranea]KYZ74973.1 methyltransferase [Anaerosporomusa subterranea]
MSEILNVISESLQEGDVDAVTEKVEEALNGGVSASTILHEGLLHGMDVMGQRWKNEEVYMPEVMIAARAMNAGMRVLKPHLLAAGVKPIGKVVLGTVKGDLHDIGKNLVNMMFVGSGFEVVDLGVDVNEKTFVQAITEHQPQIIAMAALLTTTMSEMRVVIEAVTTTGLRDQVKIMVGGAPLTQSFANAIGADAYAPDAAVAADIAKQMIGA